MRYSQLFGKTVRDAPSEVKLISHKLLYKAGFIRELAAGRYSLLPLGLRVSEKIKKIIEEEMDGVGAQRVVTPTLHPIELWKRTNRTTTMGKTLMKVIDRRGSDFVLGATHEEVFVDLVQKFNPSEKDLPIILYQFSNKFRDELRARGGLIRVREFVMKDAYSFHATAESLDETYADMFSAYQNIFHRLGVLTIPVEADSGAIGGKVSHEFMLENQDGEDTFVQCDSCGYSANTEKAEGILEPKNPDEKLREIEEIDAARGVNIESMMDFYKSPAWRLLKTIIYKVKDQGGKEFLVAVLVRGDLDINELKLAKVLGSDEFTLADDDELKKIGTVRGFVAPFDLKLAGYFVDWSVTSVKNLITGANKLNRDRKNYNVSRDLPEGKIVDIAMVERKFTCARCKKGHFVLKRGIELGHVFRLDYYYSEPMNATFSAKDGSKKKFLMGCYGIGIERAMAAVVEANHDEKGIIWPKSVSPFDVHLISLNSNEKADKVYEELTKAGIEVLYDDREDVSAGVKFSDYDLIGIPVRLVVSEKIKEQIELKERNTDKVSLLSIGELIRKLKFLPHNH